MKFQVSSFILFILCLFINSQSIAQIFSDYDKSADFTKYKTYSFKGWVKDSDKQVPELDQKRILQAFGKELDSRGLSFAGKDTEGDLAITLFVVLDKKSTVTAYTDYNGGYGYNRGPWGWGAQPMGSSSTVYSENEYTEGTVVIDIYDSYTKSLVWQGIWNKTVNENPKTREKTIPKNIKKLMAKYPIKPVSK